jgi:hypothetical protein
MLTLRQVEQLLRFHGFHRAIAGLKLDLVNENDNPFSAAAARISSVRLPLSLILSSMLCAK